MTVKVRKLKIDDVLIGMAVPKHHGGNVGRFVEDVLESNGYAVNRGHGCDLSIGNSGLEVKTRNVDTNADHTVGTMTITDICNTSYEDSNISAKMQQQYRVYFKDGDPGVVVNIKVCQFTDDCVQADLKKSYEEARSKLQTGQFDNAKQWVKVKGSADCAGHFEKKLGSSWAFRISDKAMKKFEAVDASRYYKDLFE